MRTFRIFAAVVVAAGGLTLGSSAAGAEPAGTTDVSVAVPMTCSSATWAPGAPLLAVNRSRTSATSAVTGIVTVFALPGENA